MAAGNTDLSFGARVRQLHCCHASPCGDARVVGFAESPAPKLLWRQSPASTLHQPRGSMQSATADPDSARHAGADQRDGMPAEDVANTPPDATEPTGGGTGPQASGQQKVVTSVTIDPTTTDTADADAAETGVTSWRAAEVRLTLLRCCACDARTHSTNLSITQIVRLRRAGSGCSRGAG